MWKSCTVDAIVADSLALTGGCKVVRSFLFCRKSSVALLMAGERNEHYWSSTQQWPAIVLLARLAIAKQASEHFAVVKSLKGLMVMSMYPRNS